MAVTVSTVHAVIAICDRCEERSSPMDPNDVPTWLFRHSTAHEKEDRRERMAEQGHRIETFDFEASCDDTTCRARCSCGEWESRTVKACNVGDLADDHLKTAEEEHASKV